MSSVASVASSVCLTQRVPAKVDVQSARLKKKTFFVEPPRSSTLAHVGDDIRVPPVCPQGPWFKVLALPVHFSVRVPLGFYIIGVL